MKKFLLLMVALVFVQACSSGGGGSSSGNGSGTGALVADATGFAPVPIKLSNSSKTPGDFDFEWTVYAAANDETLVVYNNSDRSLYESSDLGATWEKSFTLPTPAPTSGEQDKVRVTTIENKFFVIDNNFPPHVVYMRSSKNNWAQNQNATLANLISLYLVSGEEKSSGDSVKGPFFHISRGIFLQRTTLTGATNDFNPAGAEFWSLDRPSVNFARIDGKMYLLGRFEPGNAGVLYGAANDAAFKTLEMPKLDQPEQAARYLVRGKVDDVLAFSVEGDTPSWREKHTPFFYWAPSKTLETRKSGDWNEVTQLNRDYRKPAYSLVGFQYLNDRFILVLNKFENSKYSCVVVTSTNRIFWEENKPVDADCRALYFVKETPVIAAVKNAGPDKGKLFFLTAKSF